MANRIDTTLYNRALRTLNSLDEEMRTLVYYHLFRRGNDLLEGLPYCESPIEQLMLIALDEALCGDRHWALDMPCIVEPQREIAHGQDRFRVDFFIMTFPAHRWVTDTLDVIVECDGHEFHEKTKVQAARDKRRDRILQGMGYPVFRFTGSEIRKDATACARQVREGILSLVSAEQARFAKR